MAKNFKISNTISLVIIFSIIMLLFAATYYYLFSNLRGTVEKSSALSNETDSLVTEKANVESLKVAYSDTNSDRQKINSYFVQANGIIDFITSVENLATFAKLEHSTQSVEVKEMEGASSTHEILHLSFQTSGSWHDTYYFLSMLSTLPFNITINKANLRSDETNSKNSSWKTDYDFSVVKLK